MEGNVKWFDARKGYGFINGEDGEEIYVHYTSVVCEGFRVLRYGQHVEYESEVAADGRRQAANVRVVKR